MANRFYFLKPLQFMSINEICSRYCGKRTEKTYWAQNPKTSATYDLCQNSTLLSSCLLRKKNGSWSRGQYVTYILLSERVLWEDSLDRMSMSNNGSYKV
jgi:hypothetical protein